MIKCADLEKTYLSQTFNVPLAYANIVWRNPVEDIHGKRKRLNDSLAYFILENMYSSLCWLFDTRDILYATHVDEENVFEDIVLAYTYCNHLKDNSVREWDEPQDKILNELKRVGHIDIEGIDFNTLSNEEVAQAIAFYIFNGVLSQKCCERVILSDHVIAEINRDVYNKFYTLYCHENDGLSKELLLKYFVDYENFELEFHDEAIYELESTSGIVENIYLNSGN